MSFQLVHQGWGALLDAELAGRPNVVRVAAPFIQIKAAQRFFRRRAGSTRVLTRFRLHDFYDGVSQIDALTDFVRSGASVRGLYGLHAKIFIFDNDSVVAGSANLTDAGLSRNHEFGFRSNDVDVVRSCVDHFDSLWTASGSDLTLATLEDWRAELATARSATSSFLPPQLGDYGSRVKIVSPFIADVRFGNEHRQSFVKFFGDAEHRIDKAVTVADWISEGGTPHRLLTYPTARRPRSVEDGALMFLSRMTSDGDFMVVGHATASRHDPLKDVAIDDELRGRERMARWRNYIRVRDPVLLNARLGDGVSLRHMMDELGADSFASTARNLAENKGNNDNPRRALMRKPHMELTAISAEWLRRELRTTLRRYGELDMSEARFWQPLGNPTT